ncbi:MAG: regulatory protein RecX [Prevotella sp.]
MKRTENMEQMSEQEAWQKLSALCARSEHCTGEMARKMERWGLDGQVQTSIMKRLVRERFVDDERYVRAFINDKIAYDRWGSRKIEQALRAKRIDADLVERLLGEVDEQDFVNALRPLVEAKRHQVKAQSDYERKMKLMRFAAGKGFTFDVIRQCLDCDEGNGMTDED